MQIEIKNRYTGKIILYGEYESVKDCLERNRGANLWGADLERSDLWGADLSEANLEGVYLEGAKLWRADLQGANLKRANLEGAKLWRANLSGANLEEAYLEGAKLWRADLQGANLKRANLEGAKLWRAYLEGANLSGANLEEADLRRANLWGAKNYSEIHEVFQEVVRSQKVETFAEKEWVCIGQICLHQLCWDSIKKRFGDTAMKVFKKLSKAGFDEWEKKYTEMMKAGDGK